MDPTETYSVENQKPEKNYRPVLIAAGSVVIFIILIIVVVVVFSGDDKKSANTNQTETTEGVAKKSDVSGNVETLKSSIDQARADQSAARTAIADSKNKVKVGQ